MKTIWLILFIWLFHLPLKAALPVQEKKEIQTEKKVSQKKAKKKQLPWLFVASLTALALVLGIIFTTGVVQTVSIILLAILVGLGLGFMFFLVALLSGHSSTKT